MRTDDTDILRRRDDVAPWRLRLAERVESRRAQQVVVAVILLNAVLLGLETDTRVMAAAGPWVIALDTACLAVFVVELLARLVAYGRSFWRSGWRIFDFLVISVALVPGGGPWAVLRALRVLRILRLLTVVPSLRRVVQAFLQAIPGLMGVIAVLGIFFYTAGVLATLLFGETFPEWFGSLGTSLFSLFQVMTMDSWSMGMVRPLMEVHPWAWAFFVPFIAVTAFTILNLFIGIIVSTMQEVTIAETEGTDHPDDAVPGTAQEPALDDDDDATAARVVERLEADLAELRALLARHQVGRQGPPRP